jgi:hypothetical protein
MTARVEITYLNTHNMFTPTVRDDVALQNKVNDKLYSAAEKQRAEKLLKRMKRVMNTEGYINLRNKFIAVKLQGCLQKLTARRMEKLIAEVHKHNAQLVFTATDGIILRLR